MSNVRTPGVEKRKTRLRPHSLPASSFVIHSSFVIRHSSFPRRRGLTLLEVLLALAISSLVLATLAAAMHFNLRVVGRRQQEIEEAQLARALLRRIADDVRGAVLYNPPDTSSLMALAGAGSPSSGGGGGGGQVLSIAFSPTGETITTSEEVETQSVAPPTIPGLRGQSDWLQVDVSRMPRRDQYDPSLQAATVTGPADHLSDVKTVTYFVETTAAGTTNTIDTSTGLMRVELARAVTRWANQNGTLDLSGGSPIAPEVKSIIFSYFDGVVANGWVTEWDSDERGALPVAVKIELQFVSTKKPSGLLGSNSAATNEGEGRTYSLVVHLPDRREGDVPEDVDTGGEEVQP
ncbi:MAG: prepilin-type N-terminal cleavage/methylation domain-containing protein [Planctomycetes bacterium]|nr:prepilin-type N-terminal cleavage/methylation domain-containing protein [Planctomycetota bacterium]